MFIHNVKRRTLDALAVGVCLTAVASADVIVDEDVAGDLQDTILPPDAVTLSVDQFNGDPADLVGIKLEIETTLRSVLTVTNNSPQSSVIEIRNEVPVMLINSPINDFRFSAMLANESNFNGDLIANGETRTTGDLFNMETRCLETGTTTCEIAVNLPDVVDQFLGAGTLDFDFGIASGSCSAAGPGNVEEICVARVQVKVRVTYTTTEDCPKINRRRCSSLLLFPEFDNRDGIRTVATVTNKNPDKDVCVHYIYVGRKGHNGEDLDCEEFDRTECLTPNDTLTVMTNYHNPQMDQGYFYAYAVEEDTREAISANDLIGHLLVVDGLDAFEYAVNPVDYRAIPERGELTDDDEDGVRDLNGTEYEKTACEILIPRFLGQGDRIDSKMIFIGLSGGAQFTTTADILLYNDNEEAFSANHTFRCWDKVRLTEISNAFKNDFLKTTNDDYYERLGPYEFGWIRIKGKNAHAGFKDIKDPAIYAVLIEIISGYAAADLPFEMCHNKNGHLLPRGVSGDNEE